MNETSGAVRMQIWLGDGSESFVTGKTNSQLFNNATAAGAIRAVCPWFGEIYRWLYGDWVGVGHKSPVKEKANAR